MQDDEIKPRTVLIRSERTSKDVESLIFIGSDLAGFEAACFRRRNPQTDVSGVVFGAGYPRAQYNGESC